MPTKHRTRETPPGRTGARSNALSTVPTSPTTPTGATAPARPRMLVLLVGLAALVVVVAGAKASSSLLGPVFLALVVTVAVHPLRRRLARRLPSWVATLLCLLLVGVVVVGFVVALVAATARFGSLLADYQADARELVDDVSSLLADAGVSDAEVRRVTGSFDLSRLAAVVGAVLSGVAGAVSALGFVLALLLFMALDGARFPDHLAAVRRWRPDLVAALDSFVGGTRHYLFVSTVFGLVVAVVDTAALVVLDVPAPLLWGLLAFLSNYIPNIGFVIGLVPPALLALLDGGAGLMVAVVAVYVVANVVIQSGIQPRVVGNAVGLSSTLTFLSLVFWSWVLGPLGAVLAIPLSLLVRALLVDADPSSRWLVPLISNGAVPSVTPASPPGEGTPAG